MSGPLDRRHATALFADLLARGTRRPVHLDGEVPPGAEFPFAVVCVRDDAPAWASSLASDYDSPALRFQVSCAGRRQDQAEALADRVRRTVTQRAVGGGYQVSMDAPDGWAVARRASAGYHGVEPAGEQPHVVWTAYEDFELLLSRA